MLKIAVQILFFDCDQFILRAIANSSPFVDKIFITYSPEPWSAYNKEARSLYKNPSNTEILKSSPYYHKIELIEGVWETEEDQRNDCLNRAKAQGYDFLIIQDADEFYLPEELKKNIEEMRLNPDYSYYRSPWHFFWKSTKYIIKNMHPVFFGNQEYVAPYKKTILAYNACFAINLRKDVSFKDKRIPDKLDYLMLKGLCFHLSYVLSDDQLLRKLKTWGHSHQVDIENWLKVKWYGWTPSVKNIHPINLIEWPEVEEYHGELPVELKDFNPGIQRFTKVSKNDYMLYKLRELYSFVNFVKEDVKYYLKKLF